MNATSGQGVYHLMLGGRKKLVRQKIPEALTQNDEFENFVNAYMETAAECNLTKLKGKHRVPWETLERRKKQDNVNTSSLCDERNPTDVNTQKRKKAQRELTKT